jgi:hypothetical protein
LHRSVRHSARRRPGPLDLGFQTYASKKDPPPADKAWLGAGGWGIPCLAGQSQYVATHSLESGTKYLKIEMFKRGTRILREVYELRGMVPIKTITESMSQIKKRPKKDGTKGGRN